MNIKNNKNCKITINDEVISVSEKEKMADELFKELGYIKYDNHPEQDFPTEPNMFTTQDVRRLYYEQTGVLENGMKGLEHIEFDLIKRNVVCWAKINEEIPDFEIQIKEKVKNIIENLSDYCVFKEKSVFEKESLGQKLLNNAVEENKNILNEKVIEIYKGLSKQDIATEICGILEEKIENMFKGE